jgi:polysaccharide deacetylase 2 family uncharacterized protein YibQ
VAFWGVIVLGAAGGVSYLQYLGPPPAAFAPVARVDGPGPVASSGAARPASGDAVPAGDTAAVTPAGPANVVDDSSISAAGLAPAPDLPRGAPIPGPIPALLTASSIDPHWLVPRIGPNGLTPMQAYAASPLPPPAAALLPPNVPRVALIIAGLGDDPALDRLAAGLPPEISLALSPYGKDVADAAVLARGTGHETILVLPMPGLLAGYPARQNQSTLDWSMAQFQGFAGVTDAFSPAMGGGFLVNATSKAWLMTEIARKGLFYIEGDTNAGMPPLTAGRAADMVIDASDGAADESVKLSSLITEAEAQQSAVGIMLNPTPDALRGLENWAAALVNEDVLLVPVSALVQPPDIPLPVDASLKQ